jgi:RNA polymerase sigma-70 factor (ECF subfamily)
MLAVAESKELPVREAKAGDPEAWNRLFQRYQLPLYSYVFELVRDEQTSLDIVQETFINAVRHIGGLRDDEKFGSWLFGIAHQKCIQRWRKPSREESICIEELESVSDDEPGPSEWLISKEQEEEFMLQLNQLPPPQRSVLLLHLVEDFSLEEIAGITMTAIGTVKSRLHYARNALRKLLEKERL